MIKVQEIGMALPPEAMAQLNEQAIKGLVRDLASAARARWIQFAQKDKSSFKKDYINGIQAVRFQEGTAIITLVGEIPHMLEDGAPSLDMRTTLLGDKIPVVPIGERGKHANKRGGFYRAIPFRHATPTAGSVAGSPMGSSYAGNKLVPDAKRLGRMVYKAAKKLSATKGTPYGKTVWGERLDTSKMDIPLLAPHHKTDIYAGMVRAEKTYAKATQSTYHTFRTISTSVTTGWIRKPIMARHYADKVVEYVQKIAPMSLAAFLEAQG